MLLLGNPSIPFLLSLALVLLLGMGWHEYAHAIIADRWGDPTPRQHGRLTPNPFVHIYWPGWLMFVVLGFGILGSVPVNPQRMRNPRWGSFWTSLAGPLSNLVMALISGILLRLVGDPLNGLRLFSGIAEVGQLDGTITDFLSLFFVVSIFFNSLLFVFNLLPLFPLDGWHIVLAMLPGYGMPRQNIPATIRQSVRPLANLLAEPAYTWQRWAQASQYLFLALIFISFLPGLPSPLGALIVQPTSFLMRLFTGI